MVHSDNRYKDIFRPLQVNKIDVLDLLDMNNNNINRVEALNSDGSTTNINLVDGGSVNIPNGNLDMSGNNINNPGTIGGFTAGGNLNINGNYIQNSPSIAGVSTYDLVGFWSFEDGTDPTKGWSKYGNDGDLVNGPTWTGGRIGQALDFDGTDDYVEVPDDSSLRVTDDLKYTITAWVKTSDNTKLQVVVNKENSSYQGYYLGFSDRDGDGDYELFSYYKDTNSNDNWIWSDALIPDGNWHHITITANGADASNWDLWVDGSKVSKTIEKNQSVSGTTTTAPLRIGKRGTGIDSGYFNGTIDEVRIYDRVLSKGEIKTLYQMGKKRKQEIGGAWLSRSGKGEMQGNLNMNNNSIQNVIEQNLNGRDSAPASPSVGDVVLASPTWDPDGDGNGEVVVYDGTAWQEMADMPNYT